MKNSYAKQRAAVVQAFRQRESVLHEGGPGSGRRPGYAYGRDKGRVPNIGRPVSARFAIPLRARRFMDSIARQHAAAVAVKGMLHQKALKANDIRGAASLARQIERHQQAIDHIRSVSAPAQGLYTKAVSFDSRQKFAGSYKQAVDRRGRVYAKKYNPRLKRTTWRYQAHVDSEGNPYTVSRQKKIVLHAGKGRVEKLPR
jgi:hypothetical protein